MRNSASVRSGLRRVEERGLGMIGLQLLLIVEEVVRAWLLLVLRHVYGRVQALHLIERVRTVGRVEDFASLPTVLAFQLLTSGGGPTRPFAPQLLERWLLHDLLLLEGVGIGAERHSETLRSTVHRMTVLVSIMLRLWMKYYSWL